ncbi:MAG: hypothetical protein ACOCMW_00315, partial [Campylobacter hyointestinalis]
MKGFQAIQLHIRNFFKEVDNHQDKNYKIHISPRFDIIGYQFKCINTSVKMFLHDDSILDPRYYDIPAFYNFSYTFSEITEKPYYKASHKDLSSTNDEFAGLYLLDYS